MSMVRFSENGPAADGVGEHNARYVSSGDDLMDILNWIVLIVVAIMLIVAIVRATLFAPGNPQRGRQSANSGDLGGGNDSGGPWDSGSHHGGGHDRGHGAGDGGGGGY
jgi:uncharacterized membrane protein